MAIIGPNDLPAILKVSSDPMKGYVLRMLGYPNIAVEITEDQLESALRVTGDFIAQFFPREQRFAVFYTNPLQPTYPMPEDAYWVQEISWDPITTRIDDVFGAESYLFCLSSNVKILDKDNRLQHHTDWKPNWKAKTPFGNRKLKFKYHNNKKLLPKVRIEYDGGIITATTSHVVKANDKWREFGEIVSTDKLHGVKNIIGIQNIQSSESVDAISIRSSAGCYYGCDEGDPILLH